MSVYKDFDSKKEYFTTVDIPKDDRGISVRDTVPLISGSQYEALLLEIMGVEDLDEEFIAIPGAYFLVSSILRSSNKYLKFDINSEYQDLSFEELQGHKNIKITFTDLSSVSFSDSNRSDEIDFDTEEDIVASPVYSAKSDYFSEFFSMGRYATSLLKDDSGYILAENMRMIQDLYKRKGKKFSRKYRLLRNKEGNTYLRAITSTDAYKDYHIGVSVFVALIALYKDMSANNSHYRVVYGEHNESSVRVFFEKVGEVEVEGFGRIQYGIELFNDETKKSSVRLSGVSSVILKNGRSKQSLFMDTRSKSAYEILELTHGTKPENIAPKLNITENIAQVEKDIYDDIHSINKVKNINQLKFYFKQQIEASKNKEIKKYAAEIKKIIEPDKKIRTIHSLLTIMGKVDSLLQDQDLEAKEFLRYLIYDVVTRRKPKKKKPDNDSSQEPQSE